MTEHGDGLASRPSVPANSALAGAGPGAPPLDAVLAAIPDGVLVLDVARRITWVNATLTALTGYRESELLGRSPRFLWRDHAEPEARRRVELALASGRAVATTIRARRKDGTSFWSDLTLTPVADAFGALAHLVAVVRDVSQRRRLEEQLAQSQRWEALGQMTCGLAHDFNNLLTIINGHVDLLRTDGRQNVGAADSIGEIAKAVDRAAGLTRRLLAFGRRQPVELRIVDLGEVAEQLVAMLDRVLGDGIRVQLDRRRRSAPVLADAAMLEQVVMNLCVNARDAMPAGGDLLVAVEAGSAADIRGCADVVGSVAGDGVGDFVWLTVADGGRGVDPADRRRIFEPFFSTKGAAQGRGLGLATVAAIVRQLGGCCGVDGAAGGGARFSVWLPVAHEQ